MLGRVLILCFVFMVIAVVFIGRLAQLQLLHGREYASEAFAARFVVDVLPARRGKIIDRNGVVIADNRTVYNVAVVLQELSLDRRTRWRTPLWELDEESLNLLAGTIASEVQRPLASVREQMVDELLLNPGVAVRYGQPRDDLQLGLLALPRSVMLGADEAGEADVDEGYQALASGGLLLLDPRQALRREFRLRRGQSVTLIDDRQWEQLLGQLSERWQTPRDHLREIMAPFMPHLELTTRAGEDDQQQQRWRVLEESRRSTIEAALARYLGESSRDVHDALQAALHVLEHHPPDTPWLYVASAQITELGQYLPRNAPLTEVELNGIIPQRERLLLIQGANDPDDPRSMYSLVINRLLAALDIPAARDSVWLAALVEHHARRLSLRQAEREHRVHHLMLDALAVRDFCRHLSEELASSTQSLSPLAIEQRLTQARRLADREWRGSTRHDPLIMVDDIEANIANRIAGMGSGVPAYLARKFADTRPRIPGLQVVTDIGREYPFPGSASHIIGYLGKLSAVYDHRTALAMGLDPQGWLGRSGLESEYDQLLQGSNGRRARLRTPDGYRLVEETMPVPGVDMHLTLDMELQRIAERACYQWHDLAVNLGINTPRMDASFKRVNHHRAAMILVDVDDGAILAMASQPSFDLYDIRQSYRELADPEQNPGQPLIDHASSASHPPGSTIKPLITLIALATGQTQPDEVIFSRGYMARNSAGRPILREFQPFTPRDFTLPESLSRSSNVVAATLAERVGPEQLTTWLSDFGFGQRNALDVGWQRPGLLPTPANLANLRPSEPTWYPSDTWRMGIGQFASSAPLQVVSIPAAVANAGRIIRPYLWQEAPQELSVPEGPQRLPIDAEGLATVQRGMEMVTEPGGTATAMRLTNGPGAGIPVAAKTGTSEWGTPKTRDHDRAMRDPNMVWTPSHGWLIGYAPADDPQVAFAIFVYGGTSGGRAGTGIAKEVLEAYFDRYPPTER